MRPTARRFRICGLLLVAGVGQKGAAFDQEHNTSKRNRGDDLRGTRLDDCHNCAQIIVNV
jgi:hypothetical protein